MFAGVRVFFHLAGKRRKIIDLQGGRQVKKKRENQKNNKYV